MSSPAEADASDLPDTVVRNRSQYSDTLHRLDPAADEPRPACPEPDYRGECDFTGVPLAAYWPHVDT